MQSGGVAMSGGYSGSDVIWATVFLTVMVVVYLLPWLIAWGRNHRQAPAIFFLNLLAGWTLAGWVGALVWALIRDKRQAADTAPLAFTYRGYAIVVDQASGVARIADHEFRDGDAAKIWVDQQVDAATVAQQVQG